MRVLRQRLLARVAKGLGNFRHIQRHAVRLLLHIVQRRCMAPRRGGVCVGRGVFLRIVLNSKKHLPANDKGRTWRPMVMQSSAYLLSVPGTLPSTPLTKKLMPRRKSSSATLPSASTSLPVLSDSGPFQMW